MVPTWLIYHGSLSVHSHSISRTNACYGLVNNSAISDHSCLGDGTCTMPFGETKPYAALIVESGSCKYYWLYFEFWVSNCNGLTFSSFHAVSSGQNCNACANINGFVSIDIDSCYGHASCGEMSGNVTIGTNSCNGKEACSYSLALSTIKISDGSCLGSACKSMSGNVLVGSTSCIGRESCEENQGMETSSYFLW